MSFLRPKVNVQAPEIPPPPPAVPMKPVKADAQDRLAKDTDGKKVNKGSTIATSPKGVLDEAPLAFASLLSTADIKKMTNFLTNGKSSKT
tara:strand:+ start:6988 stop:7257 length:270 start_codon:yes stop_codon:yes gene_type:complete